jgi:hypothetical protein
MSIDISDFDFDDLTEEDPEVEDEEVTEDEEVVEDEANEEVEENDSVQKDGEGDEFIEDDELFGQGIRVNKKLEPDIKAFKEFRAKNSDFEAFTSQRSDELRIQETQLLVDTDLTVAKRIVDFELQRLEAVDMSKIEDSDDKLAVYERIQAAKEEQAKVNNALQNAMKEKQGMLAKRLNNADASMSRKYKDDWNDKTREAVVNYGQTTGLTREQLIGVAADSIAIDLLYKAMRFDSQDKGSIKTTAKETSKEFGNVSKKVRVISNQGGGKRKSMEDIPFDDYVRIMNARDLGVELD